MLAHREEICSNEVGRKGMLQQKEEAYVDGSQRRRIRTGQLNQRTGRAALQEETLYGKRKISLWGKEWTNGPLLRGGGRLSLRGKGS